LSAAFEGKNIMLSQDCKTCHKVDEKSIGPSFTDVARRYAKDPDMVSKLMQKVIRGGSGSWGEVAMPAHPALKEEDIRQIIDWIKTLSGTESTVKSLPARGDVDPTMHQPMKDNGVLTIMATFTNKGGDHIRPLTGGGAASLRNSKINMRRTGSLKGPFHRDHLDLTDIVRLEVGVNWNGKQGPAWQLEVRLDSATGKKIADLALGEQKVVASADGKEYSQVVSAPMAPVTDGQWHKLYIVGTKRDGAAPDVPVASWFIRLFNH